MDEIIQITTSNNILTVSGRELHEALKIETPYKKWFDRMCEYGFTENDDYSVMDIFVHNSNGGKQSRIDHQITLDMAKELCMIQRSEKGREFRKYFIDAERKLRNLTKLDSYMIDDPVERAKRWIEEAQERKMLADKNAVLETENIMQKQQILEMSPKITYYDEVLRCTDGVIVTQIAKDYGWSAKKLNAYLRDKGVQYKRNGQWLLYQQYAELGYTKSKTSLVDGVPYISTLWTQKGRLFIYDLLKSDGILPTIEKKEVKP